MKRLFLILFLLVFATFWLLDGFAISTGDDLGYMFTDACHHDGSGHRVTSLSDVFNTQINHYRTTNGRFLVHVATQSLVSLAPAWVFRLINSLMFALLWLFTIKLCGTERNTWGAIMVWLLLWIGLPAPGVNLLGLVAVATNYLWTAVFCLAFLLLWRRFRDVPMSPWPTALLALFSLIAGSLQESFGIPLAAGLAVWLLFHRKSLHRTGLTMCLAFMVGVVIEAVAPGNLNHLNAVNTGHASLGHKIILVLKELPTSPVALLLISMLLMAIVKGWRNLWAFIMESMVLFIAVIASIGFAMLAFTATRQLFAPCLFSIILAARCLKTTFDRIPESVMRIGGIASAVVLAVLLGSVYIVRENSYRQWQRFLTSYQEQARKGANVIFADVSECNFNRHPGIRAFLKSYDADPMSGRGMSLFFDFYTKQGLSRLYAPGQKTITHLIPYPMDEVVNKAAGTETPDSSGFYTPAKLDERFTVIRVPRGRKAVPSYPKGGTVPFEEFVHKDWHYLIMATAAPVKIKGS